MTRRMLITVLLPVVGLLVLLGAIAVAARQQTTVSYHGRPYEAAGALQPSEVSALGLEPTDERLGQRQVWLAPSAAAQPKTLYLQLADGRFQVYERT